jgi:hypothetical protein
MHLVFIFSLINANSCMFQWLRGYCHTAMLHLLVSVFEQVLALLGILRYIACCTWILYGNAVRTEPCHVGPLSPRHGASVSPWPDISYCLTVTVLFFVGRPLWREDGSVFCICCRLLPAQTFSGPSPLVLATIFYCLIFETSLFVTSYDSQGHGRGIRLRLTRVALRPTVGRSVSPFWCQYPSGAHDRVVVTVRQLRFCR